MTGSAILQALQQKVIASVSASTMSALPIKFVGVTFDPPDDGKWLEIVFLPNNPTDQYWGEEENYRGSVRLILHWPNDGSGSYTPIDLIASIGRAFTKHQVLVGSVKLTDKAKLNPPVENGVETLYPVTLRYESFSLA